MRHDTRDSLQAMPRGLPDRGEGGTYVCGFGVEFAKCVWRGAGKYEDRPMKLLVGERGVPSGRSIVLEETASLKQIERSGLGALFLAMPADLD